MGDLEPEIGAGKEIGLEKEGWEDVVGKKEGAQKMEGGGMEEGIEKGGIGETLGGIEIGHLRRKRARTWEEIGRHAALEEGRRVAGKAAWNIGGRIEGGWRLEDGGMWRWTWRVDELIGTG
jgi:hypothetical protein